MRQEGKVVSIAQLCRWFTVPRSSFYYTTRRRGPGILDAALTMLVREIIDANPTYGLRRITALLRRQVDRQINRKAVHRIEVVPLLDWTGYSARVQGGCDGTNDPAVVSKAEGGAAA